MLKRLIFALAATAIAFGLAEVALGLAGVRTLAAERDPFRGFSGGVRVYEADPERGVWSTPPRSTRHSFNHQEFALEKPAGGFRFFTIGGSSAFGFPWGGEAAFTRLLADALRAAYPGRPIEGVNAAAMSYGSHRLRIVARELMDYAPDALIVDTGHNEFVEREFYGRLLERRSGLDPLRRALHRSRVYSAMTRSWERFREEPQAFEPGTRPTAELLGLDVERDVSRGVGDEQRARIVAAFEDNLRAIATLAAERGVRVVLCTVPSNVAGWAPNESIFGDADLGTRQRALALLARAKDRLAAGPAAEAVAELEQARALVPEHAEIAFRLGSAYAALGRFGEARKSFATARDLDARPTRAPSSINDAIRRVARATGAILVDVERDYEAAAPNGLVGFNLLEDYVHPNPLGHRRIAYALYRALLDAGLPGEPRPARETEFLAALGPGASLEVRGEAERPTVAAGSRAQDMLFNLGAVLENQGLADEAMEKYRACIAIFPGHYKARENLARLLFRRGAWVEAAEQYQAVLELEPGRVKALVGLAEALRRTGDVPRALALLERAVVLEPGSAVPWSSLGGTLTQQGRHVEAEAAFRRAVENAPDDPEARVGLGLAQLYRGRPAVAEATFRDVLRTNPHHLRGRNGLAAALTELGRLDEAERIFRENLAAAPDDSFARGGLELIERRRAGA